MDLSKLLELVNTPTLRPFATQDVASIKATLQAEMRDSVAVETHWPEGGESMRRSAQQRARATLLDRCAWATGGNLDVVARAGLLLVGLGVAIALLMSQTIGKATEHTGPFAIPLVCGLMGGVMFLLAAASSYRREARLRTEGLQDLIDEWESEVRADPTVAPTTVRATPPRAHPASGPTRKTPRR